MYGRILNLPLDIHTHPQLLIQDNNQLLQFATLHAFPL